MLAPYDLLLGLALLHEKNRQEEPLLSGWSGVLVQVAKHQILIERESLKEILTVSKATRVVDNRSWLTGVIGYEGAIIPLIELSSLLDEIDSSLEFKDRSLVVISCENENIGLLVDKIHGHRDYWSDNENIKGLKVDKQGFNQASFSCDGKLIEICNLDKLAVMMGIRKEAVISAV